MRVLLVEDSKGLRKHLALALRRTGYAVDEAADGEDGLALARAVPYDAIVLDIMLPKLDGLALIDRLREEGSDTPVLFLTARDTVEDRVRGLRRGADDYVVKPFSLDEVLARVEALCRRRYRQAEPVLRLGELALDPAAKKVTCAAAVLDLPPREFRLLQYLLLRNGEVATRTEIEEHIYDDLAAPMSNVVDAAVYSLRKRLARHAGAPRLVTRRGLGYVLEAPAA